ncbi:hypothetical protein PybrP1_007064 [[Pythium] brassicae (nom. inval.)]|nr:hypothetical protein PybrP1_007064 [[Pythium] brassicae (nom. inval.)]
MDRSYAIRRSVDADQNDVVDLEFPDKTDRKTYFGRVLLSSVIETSLLALTATDPERPERILGFAAFDSRPPGEVGEHAALNDYLLSKYDLPRASTWLFLTYFAQRQSSVSTRASVLKHLLHTVYCTMLTRQRVLLVLPRSVDLETESNLNKFFEKVPLRASGTPLPSPTAFEHAVSTFEAFAVYQSTSADLLPALHVRTARVEDHDDLEPILRKQNESVTGAFGAYFLAELIHSQDARNVCLIAQGKDSERATGLVALSGEIDISALHESFELGPYNKLGRSRVGSLDADKLTPPRLLIVGPPAGGKGTQCELLVEEFGVVHMSTGDMLRAEIQAGSPLGLEAQAFMTAGELVPDELVVDVVLARLQLDDCATRGWLLDGFPRTARQAQAMVTRGILPDAVVVLDVPDEEVVKRISGRRVDPETGRTYHLEFSPPPPQDEALRARLVQRADDTEATIRNRLVTFHDNCDAVVGAFAAAATVLRVNGLQSKHSIAHAIAEAVHAVKNAQTLKALVRRQVIPAPKLIITGPPAGGKGTQCEVLVEHFDVVHLSTGDMLRTSIQAGAPLGLKAKSFMDAGELVPDELIVDVILERLTHRDCATRGWLLDGFPRTAAQARAMVAQGIVPDCVLVLDVPDDEVIARISGRRVDPVTGKTYHVTFNPPPPDVQARVVQRSDDNEDTIKNRLEKYHANCDAVLGEFAASAHVQIVRCDGMQPRALTVQAFTAPVYQKLADVEARYAAVGGLAHLDVEEARANCFAITLFCMDERFEYGAKDLLANAFAAFADKDFCLLTLPTTAPEPGFVGFFTSVPPKPTSTFTHCLYLLHRDAISFFSPTCEGVSVLTPVTLSVHRHLPVAAIAQDDADELKPLLLSADPATRAALQHDILQAGDESDVATEENPKHIVFVVRANGHTVGAASLTRNHEFASVLKHHFDLESFLLLPYHRSKDQAIVECFVLNPIFERCTRYVFEEIMRIFNKSCVFHQVPTARRGGGPTRPAAPVSAIVHEFVLAPPRRSADISADEVAQYPDDAERVRHNASYDEFALFALSKKLLSEPKLVVNQRVVVVGASDTAFTLLQRLLSVPYLRLTNVTLVSPHGMEIADLDAPDPLAQAAAASADADNRVADASSRQPPRSTDFARRSLLCRKAIDQFSLRTHIRVVESRVVQIDRLARAVLLRDGSCLPYDYLALTTGLQDGTCTALGRLPVFDGDVYTPPAVPENVLALHDVKTSERLHEQLRHERDDDKLKQIVVYGSSLFALQVIHGLLARGVHGSRIVHVSPARDSLFEDSTIRAEIAREYAKHGVTVHYYAKIVHLVTTASTHTLEGVHLASAAAAMFGHPLHHSDTIAHSHSHGHPPSHGGDAHDPAGGHPATPHSGAGPHGAAPTVVPCAWLLCCQQNDADYDIFRAINESGLVYDGRLVVNGHMRTTDPHVFAAGSLCRFSRRFIHAKLQEHYSSRECGELLAASLLRVLDPLAAGATARPSASGAHGDESSRGVLTTRKSLSGSSSAPGLGAANTVVSPTTTPNGQVVVPPPEMHMPVVRAAVVLGGKHYVQISVPSLTNTLSLQALPTNAESASSSNSGARYTCLLFDDVGVLNRLEYLGDERVEVANLQCLVGMHESYLNSAVASFSSAYVTDWLAFFRGKWAAALYHDRFADFCVRLNGFLRKDDGVRQLVEDVGKFFSDTGDAKGAAAMAQVRVGRGGDALEPSTKRLVESQLLEFLSANRDVLSMYLLPRGGKLK